MDIKKMLEGIILGIVGVVAVFYVIGGTSTALTNASDNISGSGLPLAGLFGSSGVVLVIFMLAVFIGVIYLAFKMFKK